MISSRRRNFARLFAGLAIGLASSGFWATAANAFESAMLTGGLTSQPVGHYEFCRDHRAECAIRSDKDVPEAMSDPLWRKITSVNAAVNRRVRPMNDFDIYGQDEVWAYPGKVGDCEDYVLEKRRLLSDSGIAISNLLITVVRKPDGEGHAVLTVRTNRGDFILDNLTDNVLPWAETGYRYLKRQANNNTGRWVSIREGDMTLVGSVQ
jgi:predicted transglutaminase-like cysteine proteinase